MRLTAPLSHLCFLIPPLFYRLTLLLLLRLLRFLLLPSAAEAVQATEAGTCEGHGLPDAPHSRTPARGGGGGGGGRGRKGGIKTLLLHLAICQGIALFVRNFLLNAHGYLASKKKKEVLIFLCELRQSEFSEKNF